MSSEKSFVKGTAVLVVSSVIVKILSAIYRIPLTRMLGAEAIGTYSAVFNLFLPFYAFATAGITPTISRLSAEIDSKNFHELFLLKRKSRKIFTVFSIIMIFLALVVSALYANYIDTMFLFVGVVLLCPNLFFASFEAIYKGISQGSMNMGVTAKANLLESASKIVIGLGSVYLLGVFLKDNASNFQIAAALLSVSVAGFICWAYMAWDFSVGYKFNKLNAKSSIGTKKILAMALPISLSALVVSGTNFFDTVICLSIIKKIPTQSLINAYNLLDLSGVSDIPIWLFGVYQGLTLTVLGLIPSLASAIGASSLPMITKSKLAGDKEKLQNQVHKLMRFTAAGIVPISLFVLFFTDEVIITLFADKGAQSTLAAIFLKILAPTAIISAFSFPLNSIMHAFDKSKDILKILAVSGAVKVILSYFLCRIPYVNIKGCIYSSVIFYVLSFALSVMKVHSLGVDLKLVSVLFTPVASSYVILTVLSLISKGWAVSATVKCVTLGVIFVVFYAFFILISDYLIDNYS